MKARISLLFIFVISLCLANAQRLKPGFDKSEYIELLRVSSRLGDSSYFKKIAPPIRFHFVYRSPVVGLENRWDLWSSNDSIAVISIRGTTTSSISWMANFYAAMVPAKGSLQLSANDSFSYHLADNPKAAVHVGWLVSTAFLSKDILPKIDSLYHSGTKDILIMGHSQGGAIAYLLTAYLYNLQKQQSLPADIRFKTYCSAGPKPGNLYFAYDYEAMTRNGWAYNVVNSADWVPETPTSIQTLCDFNTTNPFTNARAFIKKQKWPKRWLLRYAFGRVDNPSSKAAKNYQKYLGKYVSKSIKEHLPGFVPPDYYNSQDYVRTGNTIVLLADEDYYKLYPDSKTNVFVHHFHAPYIYLAQKFPNNKEQPAMATLNGTWELNYISGRKIAFEGLYPGRKPFIKFDVANNKFAGNTSCNSFGGTLHAGSSEIHFTEPFMMTKMMCAGEGEQAFLDVLQMVDHYSTEGNTLTFIKGDVAVMRFERK
jgi:heat shock protein HslJ